eukprot:6206164-Pleurochrysis_carterae.AAC.1
MTCGSRERHACQTCSHASHATLCGSGSRRGSHHPAHPSPTSIAARQTAMRGPSRWQGKE